MPRRAPAPYESFAQRRSNAERAMQRLAQEGIELKPFVLDGNGLAQGQRARSFLAHFASIFPDQERRARGRSYVLNGLIIHYEQRGNELLARLSGSQSEVYRVFIQVARISREATQRLLHELSEHQPNLGQRALSEEQLPGEFLDHCYQSSGLFPGNKEYRAKCTCEDEFECKHISAVWHAFAHTLDATPEALLALRGVNLTGLRSSLACRAALAPAPAPLRRLPPQKLEAIFHLSLSEPPPTLDFSALELPDWLRPAAIRRPDGSLRYLAHGDLSSIFSLEDFDQSHAPVLSEEALLTLALLSAPAPSPAPIAAEAPQEEEPAEDEDDDDSSDPDAEDEDEEPDEQDEDEDGIENELEAALMFLRSGRVRAPRSMFSGHVLRSLVAQGHGAMLVDRGLIMGLSIGRNGVNPVFWPEGHKPSPRAPAASKAAPAPRRSAKAIKPLPHAHPVSPQDNERVERMIDKLPGSLQLRAGKSARVLAQDLLGLGIAYRQIYRWITEEYLEYTDQRGLYNAQPQFLRILREYLQRTI